MKNLFTELENLLYLSLYLAYLSIKAEMIRALFLYVLSTCDFRTLFVSYNGGRGRHKTALEDVKGLSGQVQGTAPTADRRHVSWR